VKHAGNFAPSHAENVRPQENSNFVLPNAQMLEIVVRKTQAGAVDTKIITVPTGNNNAVKPASGMVTNAKIAKVAKVNWVVSLTFITSFAFLISNSQKTPIN
jgi:hypothetical protein